MRVRLLAPAERELDDAVAYYDAQFAGLGSAFLNEAGPGAVGAEAGV